MSVRTKPNNCPACGHHIDAATPASGKPLPTPGDFTICAYCATLAVFDDDLCMRRVTREEWDSMSAYEAARIATVQGAIMARLITEGRT